MSEIVSEVDGLHEYGTGSVLLEKGVIQRLYPEVWTAIQMLLDRDGYIKDTLLDEGDFRVNNGAMQVKMTNKTGAASVTGQLVAADQGIVVSGGGGKVTSAAITGKTNANSKAGRIWYKLSIPAGAATIQLYSDEAKTGLVAHGALGDNLGGTINLVADGASGIGGTVVVAAAVAALDTTSEHFTFGSVAGFQKAATNERDWIGVVAEADIANGSSCWVTISGMAQMLIEAAGDVGYGDWVRSGATTAGRVQADSAWDPLYCDRYIGRSIGRKEAGVGTTCGVMILPRRSAALPSVPADGEYNLLVAAGVASWVVDGTH